MKKINNELYVVILCYLHASLLECDFLGDSEMNEDDINNADMNDADINNLNLCVIKKYNNKWFFIADNIKKLDFIDKWTQNINININDVENVDCNDYLDDYLADSLTTIYLMELI